MKERTIVINEIPFTYVDEVGDPYVFNPMTQEDMDDILQLSARLLKECGVEFMLAFGTLLGAVREGNFIKGDDDVDIIITDEEKLYESLPYLWEHGLFINRIFENELFTFHTDGRRGHVDMYVMHPIEKGIYKNWCVSIRGHYAPKRFFEGIVDNCYRIGAHGYPCTKNPENLLAWWYGKSWRIPQSKKPTEDVLIRRIWLFPSKMFRKILRRIKRVLKKGA